MILKAMHVERDDKDKFLSEAPVASIYVIPDPTVDATEQIDYDSISIEQMDWTPKMIQVIIHLCGYDSNGKKYLSPDHKRVLLQWAKEHAADLWALDSLDDPISISLDHIKAWIHAGNNVERFAREKWNLKLESKLVSDDGTTVIDGYKKKEKA